MNQVERARVISQSPTTCAILDEDGQPTGELVYIPPRRWHRLTVLPWTPTPVLTTPVDQPGALLVGYQIWLVRDNDNRGQCAKWTHYTPEEIEHAFYQTYRLVRVTDNDVHELWRNNRDSTEPRWHQILRMSARWPKLADGTDELSISYKDATAGNSPTSGLVFQIQFGQEWVPCWRDLRAPIEEVPAELLS